MKQRRILVIQYSQTGQLQRVVDAVTGPLHQPGISLDSVVVQPQQPFPFPWPLLRFFSIFPETVAMRPIPLQPLPALSPGYDLVIIAYQVWFLSPSLPISSWLQSDQAKLLLADTPVMTLCACRGMWLMAQEKVKKLIAAAGGQLIDNAVLTDSCGSAFSFLATPLWMFTGKRQPWRWLPAAGVADGAIADARRFGEAMRERLLADSAPLRTPMLSGLRAVTIHDQLIASEKVGQRSFALWGKLLTALGPAESRRRQLGLVVYIGFLISLILTVVPLTALLKKLLAPLGRRRIAAQRYYFSQPSGE